ncbi:MAG: hypothetical protein ACPIOQ_83800, partial [Promethearchaeia archaeon]
RLEYAGTFVDGRRDGYGVMSFADKTQYEGEWESGRTSGYGRESYPDGSSYGGQFHTNARHGLGTYTDHSENKFAGLWEEGNWGRGVEEEEQPQLEAVMAYSVQTSAQALEISERVEVLRQLRLHLPSTYRGMVANLIGIDNLDLAQDDYPGDADGMLAASQRELELGPASATTTDMMQDNVIEEASDAVKDPALEGALISQRSDPVTPGSRMSGAENLTLVVQQAFAAFGNSISVVDSQENAVTIGCTENDLIQGAGLRFWPEGDDAGRLEYAGTFVDGRRDGYGV